jgi:signal transduction histidine kinase
MRTLTVSDLARGDMVLADVEKTRTVLANLITNAIRHTPQAGRSRFAACPGRKRCGSRSPIPDRASPKKTCPTSFDGLQGAGSPSGGVGLGLSIVKD